MPQARRYGRMGGAPAEEPADEGPKIEEILRRPRGRRYPARSRPPASRKIAVEMRMAGPWFAGDASSGRDVRRLASQRSPRRRL